MANPEHLAEIVGGVNAWNKWKERNRDIVVDLRFAGLAGAKLRNANLKQAYLNGANLSHADLRDATLSFAELTGAYLSRAQLSYASLYNANLTKANLSGAKMRGAGLSEANLSEANLSRADLIEANLSKANLSRADLSEADLSSATLQYTRLDGAKVSGIKLWETQRAGWSIKGIICERAYWDAEGKEPTEYAPGEFERLYTDQACIELFYPGGTSTFELSTLPALLHHLASLHPESNIRLKSIEETGGGAKIRISVGEAGAETADAIKSDAMQVVQAQLALRDDELNRERIEKKYLEKLFFGGLIPAMLTVSAPQNVFNAPVSGVVISNDESKVDFHQTINDNSALLALLARIMDRRGELGLSNTEAVQLDNELQSASTELQKTNPDKSAVKKSVEFVQKLATEAVTKAAGKLGESAVSADWHSLLHQLSQLLPHFKP